MLTGVDDGGVSIGADGSRNGLFLTVSLLLLTPSPIFRCTFFRGTIFGFSIG